MTEPEKQETTLSFEVPPGYRELARLDHYLTGFVQNASRSKVQAAIKAGNVTVNGVVVTRVSRPVHPGDSIECRVMRPPPIEILPEEIPLDILFEDEHLIVLNKAAGMVVHPAFGHRSGTMVHALLHHLGARAIVIDHDRDDADTDTDDDDVAEAAPRVAPDISPAGGVDHGVLFNTDPTVRPGIIHRLDKDTSGVMVVAKNEWTHARVARQFAERTISRRYVAIVWGTPDPHEGVIDAPLGRDARNRKRMAVVRPEDGKHAVTHYALREDFQYTSLCEFRLETGRTHQIRVHARSIGHPILGDATYGGEGMRLGPDTARRRAYYRNLYATLSRQALHAETLGFRHPNTGDDLFFEAPMPSDMASTVERLRAGDPG